MVFGMNRWLHWETLHDVRRMESLSFDTLCDLHAEIYQTING